MKPTRLSVPWKYPWLFILAHFVLLPDYSYAAKYRSVEWNLEHIAKTNRYFSRQVIIENQELRLPPYAGKLPEGFESLGLRQLELQRNLHANSYDLSALESLLKHADPKVRTLALGALFQRENGRDLPLIASLLEDDAPTFPDLHNSMESVAGYFISMKHVEDNQTVGQIARAMLAFWGVNKSFEENRYSQHEPVTSVQEFTRYWRSNGGEPSTAIRFRVKFERATRQNDVIYPEYHAAIAQALYELNGLPATNRAWTALYVQAVSLAKVIPEDKLVADLKAVGPVALGRFLLGQNVSGDPALYFSPSDDTPWGITEFVLRHAGELLRPQDASIPLAKAITSPDVPSPWWYAAAAEATYARSPAEARRIIADLMNQYPLKNQPDEDQQAVLQSALWRMEGLKVRSQLVEWFYAIKHKALAEQYPKRYRIASGYGQNIFLKLVEEDRKPDTAKLLKAIVSDSRFKNTEQSVVEQLAKMAGLVDRNRYYPLASPEEWNILSQQTQARYSSATLDMWRARLREHFSKAAK